MCRRVTVVVLCVCLSATYLVRKFKVQYYKVPPYGIPNVYFCVDLLKMLCLPVLASLNVANAMQHAEGFVLERGLVWLAF